MEANECNVSRAVYRALSRVMELANEREYDNVSDDTILVGPGSVLDSMGFVNFMIALEETISNLCGRAINVVEVLQRDDAAYEGLTTVQDFTAYLVGRLP